MDNLYEKMAWMSPLQFWSSLRCLQWTDYGCLWSSCHCLRSEGWPNKKTQPNQGYSIWLLLVRCLGSLKRKTHLFSYSSEKPADVFVPNHTCGKDLALDVAVTCPLQHKYLHDASVIAGFACNDYAVQVKMKNFQERVEQEGFIYLPVIFESFGGFSEDFSSFVHKLSISVSARLNEVKSATQKHLYELISCVLMKSLARSVSSRFQEFCS